MNIGAILGIIVIAVAAWVIWAYNAFIRLVNRTEEAWADIDVQLKRRYDLIPNLIETVKGYAAHEKETLNQVTQARTEATQVHVDPSNITPEQIQAMAGAEAGLTQSLGKLLAIAENYPDLKANENFVELQRELTDTENKIQASRRFYNTNVRDLNTAVQSFPQNIIAGIFKFTNREFFELGEDEQDAKDPVKVQF
ncbi:LemA family protein [Candidatus Kaiserbacteria bacterium]|nr:MAG: LemA family protein [Candidatus Kaiserbacteria bacterium]